MGGYFIDGCSYVDADKNTITASGSRGVSIEGRSDNCTLTNNTVSNSGREGLWLISSSHWRITGNTFVDNGRKDDGMVDCNILIDNTMGTFSTEVQSQDLLFEANTLVTSAFQTWAIRVSSTCKDIRIQHNELKGDNKAIHADAWLSGIGTVSVFANNGWHTENNGTIEFTGNGKTTLFTIPHGIDFSDPDDYRMLNYIKMVATLLVSGLSSDFTLNYTYDVQNLKINFSKPPPAGMVFKVDWTAAILQQIL
jgi:parallel beta-helix repeat protein